MRILKLASVVATLFATTFTTPLHAQAVVIVNQPVSYDDLDLGSDAGRATLDRRIAIAVRKVCDDTRTLDLTTLRQIRDCRREARIIANQQRDLAISDFVARRANEAIALRNR